MNIKLSLSTMLMLASALLASAQNPIKIDVDATKQIGTAKATFNGTNIEDLNYQTNGGVFSQLLTGEAFEENIDVDFLNLKSTNYSQVYVVLDETRTPHFLSTANAYTRTTWNNIGDKYDVNRREMLESYYASTQAVTAPDGTVRPPRALKIGDLTFWGRFAIFDSLPAPYQKILMDRINGKEQISRHWAKIQGGSAEGCFTLKRGDAYMGRQDQLIKFEGGKGELGIYNAGINKWGIDLQAGKPYQGVLRIKSCSGAQSVFLSLRDSKGFVLAEKECRLKGDGTFEKVEFELTPDKSDSKGRFGICLKKAGEIELGYAFMEPGEWGRVNGLHVRKMMIDALKKQGISVIRYNGSMVDVGVDTYLYRWKKMIGPIDERRICFRNGFNPYATHSFGIIELLEVAEALGAKAMVGMNINESSEDISDFVEYVNGDTSTKWGALRAKHGHPAPYNLKYIQVHNEQNISEGYIDGMKKFATAAWKVDPEMNIIASLNIGTKLESYGYGTKQYELSKKIVKWFMDQGHADQFGWDPHYSGQIAFADKGEGFENEMGITIQRNLLKDLGHKIALYPMEENGFRCDWDRGLAHAHNWNTLQRYADCFTWLGTANTLQAHMQHYMWNQGRVHFTSNEIWFQPSAWEDQMMSEKWLFKVVEATSSDESSLDVTAKMDDSGKEMKLYVVNLSDSPKDAVINVKGFKFKSKAQTWTLGDCELTDFNTVENKDCVSPKLGTTTIKNKDAGYCFPKYSYTVITLTK